MKKITNASELKEGQKYLIELEYRYDKGTNYPHDFYNNNNNKDDNVCFSINNELKNPQIDKLTIYEKQEVEVIETPCLDEIIGILEDYESDSCMNNSQKKRLTEYKKIKSILQNVGKQVDMPIVGEEYEFSNDGEKWVKDEFAGYYGRYGGCWAYIRPIQQSDEETKAIELLKNLGYKIEK